MFFTVVLVCICGMLADHFASFYVLCNENRKKIKIDAECFMLVY